MSESDLDAVIARLQDIADQLILSLKTVRNHVSNIFSQLQVVDRSRRLCARGKPAWETDVLSHRSNTSGLRGMR